MQNSIYRYETCNRTEKSFSQMSFPRSLTWLQTKNAQLWTRVFLENTTKIPRISNGAQYIASVFVFTHGLPSVHIRYTIPNPYTTHKITNKGTTWCYYEYCVSFFTGLEKRCSSMPPVFPPSTHGRSEPSPQNNHVCA